MHNLDGQRKPTVVACRRNFIVIVLIDLRCQLILNVCRLIRRKNISSSSTAQTIKHCLTKNQSLQAAQNTYRTQCIDLPETTSHSLVDCILIIQHCTHALDHVSDNILLLAHMFLNLIDPLRNGLKFRIRQILNVGHDLPGG